MTTETDFAGIQTQGRDASEAALLAWARAKFGALVDQYAPTTDELLKIRAYYDAHPGAPTGQVVDLLAATRKHTATDTLAFQHPGSAVSAPDANTLSGTPPANPTAAKKPVAPQSLSAQIAQALKDQGVTAGPGPSMDTFNPKATVYLDAPANPVAPAARQRLSPGDQLATGTGDTGSGARAGGVEPTTFQEVLTGLYKMDDTALKTLKQKLWAGGFYPAGTDKSIVDSSVPDVKTRNAYLLAVQQAARLAEAGHQTTVGQVIALGNPDPATATGAAALGPYTITNPVDLKTALDAAAETSLGQKLSPDDYKKYATLYQAMEAQSSQRYQAAGRNNQQLGVVAAPTAAAGAQDYIDQHFAAQEQAYGAVQRQQEFFHLLGPVA